MRESFTAGNSCYEKSAEASRDDAHFHAELSPGGYTAIVRGVGGTTGTAVVEAYDLNGCDSLPALSFVVGGKLAAINQQFRSRKTV
jgi:hypothetical protein